MRLLGFSTCVTRPRPSESPFAARSGNSPGAAPAPAEPVNLDGRRGGRGVASGSVCKWGLWNACLLRPQLNALQKRRAQGQGRSVTQAASSEPGLQRPVCAPRLDVQAWHTKEQELKMCHESLSALQKMGLVARHGFDMMQFWRTLLVTRIVHPVVGTPSDVFVEPSFQGWRAWVNPINIYTADHIQLDGCVIAEPGADHPSRPLLLMLFGNYEMFEYKLDVACDMARRHRCRVMLYNGRGIGASLGHERSTEHEVIDCEAALLAASRLSRRLAVFGRSLGGAVTTVALQRLHKRQALAGNEVGLLISENSFTSLGDFVVPVLGGASGVVVRRLVQGFGGNMLDAQKALHRRRLANKVLITFCPDDDVIPSGARLNEAMAGAATPNAISIVPNHPRGEENAHNDYHAAPEVNESLRRWVLG